MFIIAFNTLKEFVRNKLLYAIFFAGLVLILFGIVLTKLTITDPIRVYVIFSLTLIEIF